MKYQIKIVPNATPNADGRWIDVPRAPPKTCSWIEMVQSYADCIPAGHHMVATQSSTDCFFD
jgi:hypothetical protein